MGYESSIVFENPDYDSAIVGTDTEGRVIYDFDKMVEHLMDVDGMERDEAIEFIEYNTIRSIPYAGEMAPIIMINTDIFDEAQDSTEGSPVGKDDQGNG